MSHALTFVAGFIVGYAGTIIWPKVLALYRLNKK